MADSASGISSWKSIAPGPLICPRDLKIGTDGVFQTYLQRKKVTMMRGKAGSRRRDIVRRKMQKLVGDCQCGQEERESKTGCIELLWR